MPRSGSGIYSAPPGTTATTLTPISSSAYNAFVADLVADANAARPVNAGGTGATTAASARTNLGATSVGAAVFTAADTAAAQAAINAHLPAGMVMPFIGTAAPTGWVKLNGGTIGNVASGATTRASADTAALYSVIWATGAGVQTSGGVTTSRGSSASADYAANKRLIIPDLRAEFVRGLDDGRSVDDGRTIASTQAAAMLNHTHSGTTGSDGAQALTALVASGAGVTTVLQTTAAAAVSNDSVISDALNHTHSFTTGNPSTGGGTETRPRNVALLYCAKL